MDTKLALLASHPDLMTVKHHLKIGDGSSPYRHDCDKCRESPQWTWQIAMNAGRVTNIAMSGH